MTPTPISIADIYADLRAMFTDMIGALRQQPAEAGTPVIDVGREWIRDVALYLRDDEKYQMNMLNLLSCVDLRPLKGEPDQLAVIYHMSALHPDGERVRTIHRCAIRVLVPVDDAHVPSVARVWRTAEWHEREGYDMMGIVFDGNPDLRRILLPEDWEGYPLRKDYVTPEFYNGMRVPYGDQK
jgi:NADH-quinone oxidoreductase subunit C